MQLDRAPTHIGLPRLAAYPFRMDEIDKRVRHSALKLVAISLALVFLISLAIGAMVVYYTIDRVRVVVAPLAPSLDV